MKIKPTDLELLTLKVKPLDTPELRARYKANDFPRSDLTKNKDMRYRWDLFYMAGMLDWIQRVYDYANDDHVDTALRSFIPPLET